MRKGNSLYTIRWNVAVLLALALACTALGAGVRKRVRFPRGSHSTTVGGAVIRGEQDRYILGAKEGQTMTVRIRSVEDNAVFQIYFAGEQESLEGAGEGDDATSWSGKLPSTNDYVIVVGGTRGNASYKLEIGIE
jgi:hypothetical protein